jgi:hypothetical protein
LREECESLVTYGADTSKKVGLEVNIDKTKITSPSRHQTAVPIHYMKRVNRCFENLAQFKDWETTVTNGNPDLWGN